MKNTAAMLNFGTICDTQEGSLLGTSVPMVATRQVEIAVALGDEHRGRDIACRRLPTIHNTAS
jgi:hypothetical protein